MNVVTLLFVFPGIPRDRNTACRVYQRLIKELMLKYEGEQYYASTIREYVSLGETICLHMDESV